MRSGLQEHRLVEGRLIVCAGCVSDADALFLAAGGVLAAGRTSLRRLRRRFRVQVPVADTGTERGPAPPIETERDRL